MTVPPIHLASEVVVGFPQVMYARRLKPFVLNALFCASTMGIVLCATLPAKSASAAAAASPIGLWKTFDDKTGAPGGLVRIYEHAGSFFARIESSFTPGADTRLCKACTDERRNQPIVGLVIMRNMQLTGDTYEGGDILDPNTGSIYRCKFYLKEDGSKLVMRGFIGIALLGRSQTWQREQ